jgi:hypothetical protein
VVTYLGEHVEVVVAEEHGQSARLEALVQRSQPVVRQLTGVQELLRRDMRV